MGSCCVTESALDDLDLSDFGVSALEKSLESSSALSSVGVMLGIFKAGTHNKIILNISSLLDIITKKP